jgi:anti-sigma regulatory factor (Ser/Thr protein kinase)
MREDLDPNEAGVSETMAAYEGVPESIAAARGLAVAFLDERRGWSGPPFSAQTAADVQLIVSELVTNAVKFAPGPCTVSLRLVGRFLEISVGDSAPEPPVPLSTEPGRVGRHGLEIVLALSSSFEFHRERGGKRITVGVHLDAGDDAAG